MAPFALMRHFAPGMAERDWGRIVNVTSIAGKRPSQTYPAYSAAKAAQHSLSRAAADFWAPRGVLVNVVAPGPVGTELWRAEGGLADQLARRNGTSIEEELAGQAARVPLGRVGEPGEVADAIAFYRAHGITVERVMTDNGAAYRSIAHSLACRAIGIRHLRTRPRRPRTNGKAERFIKTMIAGWNDGAIYGSSRERAAALNGWLWTYNHRRPHGALSHKPPIARLNELNNLAGSYI